MNGYYGDRVNTTTFATLSYTPTVFGLRSWHSSTGKTLYSLSLSLSLSRITHNCCSGITSARYFRSPQDPSCMVLISRSSFLIFLFFHYGFMSSGCNCRAVDQHYFRISPTLTTLRARRCRRGRQSPYAVLPPSVWSCRSARVATPGGITFLGSTP